MKQGSNSQEKILQRLLKHAGYYWYDEDEDNIVPINPDEYDPAIDKIFKANAFELQKLYREIEDAQSEVIKGLSRVLVPDKYLLPEPGYTVAHIKPKFSRIQVNPEEMFVISGKDDTGSDHDFFFTSLFNHAYPKCEIRYLLTSEMMCEAKKGVLIKKDEHSQKGKEQAKTKFIWLGWDIGKMEPGDRISCYVGNQIVEEFNRDYSVFHFSRWYLNGDETAQLTVERGLMHFHTSDGVNRRLTDTLDIFDTYEKRVLHRFRDSFLTISDFPEDIDVHKRKTPPGFEHLASLNAPLIWIKVEFDLGIPNAFFLTHPIYPNAIPLVNRKLIARNVTKSSYDRLLLPLPTQNQFLGVNRIWDDSGHSEGYETVDYLTPDSAPASYLVRKGERVRRLNTQDAQEQIFALLDVIYDEVGTFKESGENRLTQEFQTIEKALNRIKRRLNQIEISDLNKTAYFALANIRKKASIIYYNYWECEGESVRALKDKIRLEIRSDDKQIEDSFTLIPIQSGDNGKSEDNYFNFLQSAIISRNKIVTRGDIEMFCYTRYGHLISNVSISHRIMPMNKQPAKMERVIYTELQLKETLAKDDRAFLRAHLQNELNAMSAFFTPIHVDIEPA